MATSCTNAEMVRTRAARTRISYVMVLHADEVAKSEIHHHNIISTTESHRSRSAAYNSISSVPLAMRTSAVGEVDMFRVEINLDRLRSV